jgi:nucleotide sugar dehydrogenase
LFSAPSGLNPGWCSPGWSRLRKLSAGSIRRATAGEAFYRKWLGAPTINVGSLEAAELVKLAGMVYRDVNIALANELAGVAECIGLGIWPLIKAANTDGETAMLLPGIGVGGHCTPVYPYFLIDASVDYSGRLRLTSLGRQINEDQPTRQVGRLARAMGGLSGKRVHILGLGFRPQVREDAYSSAYAVHDALVALGAIPTIEDPLYSERDIAARRLVPGRVDGAQIEAIVLNTAHPDFA